MAPQQHLLFFPFLLVTLLEKILCWFWFCFCGIVSLNTDLVFSLPYFKFCFRAVLCARFLHFIMCISTLSPCYRWLFLLSFIVQFQSVSVYIFHLTPSMFLPCAFPLFYHTLVSTIGAYYIFKKWKKTLLKLFLVCIIFIQLVQAFGHPLCLFQWSYCFVLLLCWESLKYVDVFLLLPSYVTSIYFIYIYFIYILILIPNWRGCQPMGCKVQWTLISTLLCLWLKVLLERPTTCHMRRLRS